MEAASWAQVVIVLTSLWIAADATITTIDELIKARQIFDKRVDSVLGLDVPVSTSKSPGFMQQLSRRQAAHHRDGSDDEGARNCMRGRQENPARIGRKPSYQDLPLQAIRNRLISLMHAVPQNRQEQSVFYRTRRTLRKGQEEDYTVGQLKYGAEARKVGMTMLISGGLAATGLVVLLGCAIAAEVHCHHDHALPIKLAKPVMTFCTFAVASLLGAMQSNASTQFADTKKMLKLLYSANAHQVALPGKNASSQLRQQRLLAAGSSTLFGRSVDSDMSVDALVYQPMVEDIKVLRERMIALMRKMRDDLDRLQREIVNHSKHSLYTSRPHPDGRGIGHLRFRLSHVYDLPEIKDMPFASGVLDGLAQKIQAIKSMFKACKLEDAADRYALSALYNELVELEDDTLNLIAERNRTTKVPKQRSSGWSVNTSSPAYPFTSANRHTRHRSHF